MINIRGTLVTYGEVWFDEKPTSDSAVDILIFRQRPTPLEGARCTPFLTLVTDLTVEEEKIIRAFGSTTRYEINRAEKKDRVDSRVLVPAKAALDAFSDFYNAFASQKSIEPVYRRGLSAASEAGQLILTTASRANEVLIWHAYIVWRNSAALLYSASHFRYKEQAERALVSRTNRWLHWQDMRHLRQRGLERYDWGGLFEDENSPERAGINGFKREFGGRPEVTYNCTVPVTVRGRLYLSLRRVL